MRLQNAWMTTASELLKLRAGVTMVGWCHTMSTLLANSLAVQHGYFLFVETQLSIALSDLPTSCTGCVLL
jgi:hypothetical protein